ncbi:WSC domain-containing protein [Cladorrhinum sp. PSN259]|nr:WSC domain-containing protein [Cladorrhinum sp. PSN259]
MRAYSFVTVTSVAILSGALASPFSSAIEHRAVPTIPGYNYTGCYTETSGVRALNGSSYYDDTMTAQKCASACTGFKYFGVEYGRECYCGNTINTGSVPAPAADCSFACPGDSTQDCGAGNRLNLYTRSTPPLSYTTYGYRGCYAEPQGARALPNLYQRSQTNMTIQGCASFCGAGGYTLFGLEYYEECFCDQTLSSGTLPAPETDCRFPCTGNAQQTCGGDSRLNVYEFGFTSNPGSYLSEGCYTEAQGIRALSDFAYYNDNMTVALCASACTGYNFFGVEYGRECFCGNRINTVNGSSPAPLSDCSFPCPGNPAEKCGAGNRLNLYRYLPVAAASTSTSSTTSSTSTSSFSSSSTSTTISTSAPLRISASVSSASTTTTSSFSTAPTATPTNVLSNADFESTGAWTIRTDVNRATYSLTNSNNPHSGSRAASISYLAGLNAPPQAWFNQVITLRAGTRYNFSGWTRASAANPGCSVSYSIGTVTGDANNTTVVKTLVTVPSASIRTTWTEATGFFETPAGQQGTAQYTFDVRTAGCSGVLLSARTYFVDDLSLVAAA